MTKGQAAVLSGIETNGHYYWTPRPLNVWVAIAPHNPLQEYVLEQIKQRLEAGGCLFVDPPDTATALGPVAHLGMGFSPSYDAEILPTDFLTMLPKPRGMGLVISTVEELPDEDLFDTARGLLVRKSGHVGFLVEGDPNGTSVKRVLWASMAGNYQLLTGSEDDIFNSVVLRIQAHVGAQHLTGHEGDEPARLTWDQWCASPIHQEMADTARVLGAAGYIEDEIPLGKYGTSSQVRGVLRFLNRSALGEGMRSQLDVDLRVMGVTTTGGGKIELSADPNDGQIVPVGSLTAAGYVRAMPDGCPITFNAPSVETHENGMVYVAGWLTRAGLADSFDSFLAYLDNHFSRYETIEVLPDGAQPKVLSIEHFHRQPVAGSITQPDLVEIVYPNLDRFPPIDLPCGVRESELMLLSALFQSEVFASMEPLNKMVVAMLPGHGVVAVTDLARPQMTDLLVNGMRMEDVTRV